MKDLASVLSKQTIVSQDVSLQAAREYIEQLDLSYIVAAMCSPAYPLPRWTPSDANHCLRLYKNFLLLSKKHFPEPLVPTREIDEFWHNHILYTQHYSQDCLRIFGRYLHHQPASPDEDAEKLVREYIKTKQLYLEEFNEELELRKN